MGSLSARVTRWAMPLVLALGCSGGDGTSTTTSPTDDVPAGALDAGVVSTRDASVGFDAIDPGDDASSVADVPEDDDATFAWADLPVPDDSGASPGPDPAVPSPRAQPDPCVDADPRRVRHGTSGDDTLTGTPGDDIIFGGDGDDTIDGRGGNDVLCGGNGEDHILGGDGEDYIDGGYGNDTLEGGDHRDVIHGRAGSDVIRGGAGNDLLFGDILDDDLYGDGGNDVLVGGHGTDFLHGGDGNDWMRGDTGRDNFVGGNGFDAVSFTTAMPPGQALSDTSGPAPDGVTVDFGAHLTSEDPAWEDLRNREYRGEDIYRAGVASGDGAREGLLGVEAVIGSHFNDTLIATSAAQRLYGLYGDDALRGPAGTTMDGGPGTDTCNGAGCDVAGEPPGRGANALVFVDGNSHDTGVGILGAPGDAADQITVVVGDRSVAVSTLGAPLTPGTGCRYRDRTQTDVVVCALPEVPFYMTAYGGDGDDRIMVTGGVPRDFAAHVSGGNGNDDLIGSAGDDVLFSGPTGRDRLVGNGGDDALLSESPGGMDPMTRGEAYPGGRDELDGGPGNDQLVADYPCGNHRFAGGPGIDIAGFRRSTGTQRPFFGINAQLGGPARVQYDFHGQAFNPGRCARVPWATTLEADLEILEGADGDDRLFGDDTNNVIWGWGGVDEMHGYGGNDELWGHQGNDDLTGGEGRDMLYGGPGVDVVHARDGAADARIDCGPDEGRLADSDPSDPTATRCN